MNDRLDGPGSATLAAPLGQMPQLLKAFGRAIKRHT
jgi:hypothetical protein